MDRKEILDTAAAAVLVNRAAVYSPPEQSFGQIAALWSAYMGAEYTPIDVAIFMALVKVARIKAMNGHEDSWVDLAGYAACGGEIATKGAANA